VKIVKIEDLHADGGFRNLAFLKVTTDEGLVGWSEYNEEFGVAGTTEIIHRFAEKAIGMDPREVGKISVSLHAISRMASGGLNHQAIAAIENACLDITAKALGVPVYALFGGPFRTRIPLYWSHCGTFRLRDADFFENELGRFGVRSLDDIKKMGEEVKKSGFKSFKTNPMLFDAPGPRMWNSGLRLMPGQLDRQPTPKIINAIVDQLTAFRDGCGPDIQMQLDINFGQRTEGFLRIARAVEQFDLLWLEMDMMDPEALALIRSKSNLTIASLETLMGIGAYRPFLQQQACDVAIVDIPWNGVWESVRVAALADAYEVNTAPHNFSGQLCDLMSAHYAASVPNFRIMEFEADDVPWKADFVTHPITVEDGELVLPDRPGWGTEINEEAVKARPPKKK
jgi:galactonate dehydratase